MSMSITIERSDQRFGKRWFWEREAGKWATETGELLRRAISDEAPLGKKGNIGQLRDSIGYRPRVTRSTATVEFYSRAPYAKYVVGGTPAHLILPRNANVLRWEDSGLVFYRSRVNHPGARANPFPEKAVKPLVGVIARRMKNIVIENMGSL